MNNNTVGEVLIRLDALILDPETQIRAKVCERTIKEYVGAMRSGAELPAINIAPVDPEDASKGFILIDGWHRVLAARKLGLVHFKAIVVEETDAQRFQWMAAQWNRQHGLRLTREDKRRVFRAYVKAKEHRTGRGTRVKSASEMGRDLQGIASDKTILDWMKQDYPKIYRAMIGKGLEQEAGGLIAKDMDKHFAHLATTSLDNFRASLNAVKDRGQRRGLLEAAMRMIDEVSGGRSLPVIVPDEF
jgi:hypothetical protein